MELETCRNCNGRLSRQGVSGRALTLLQRKMIYQHTSQHKGGTKQLLECLFFLSLQRSLALYPLSQFSFYFVDPLIDSYVISRNQLI